MPPLGWPAFDSPPGSVARGRLAEGDLVAGVLVGAATVFDALWEFHFRALGFSRFLCQGCVGDP